ncbi:hypothetical protein K505DRAFT_380940 [Melanomma pulvis-pyrius CBS 109.77]|uniref:Uncharacterized protein n=1 Tax=Melanomma pulvis-pyrius CBS 109.77 TaxID=1314802 RepID=A0A6A6XZK0_9PLEO|nr:hypothetical protein K505DRAFT_380940 [Melanomma pulvis-pyrius CBS 109.77]
MRWERLFSARASRWSLCGDGSGRRRVVLRGRSGTLAPIKVLAGRRRDPTPSAARPHWGRCEHRAGQGALPAGQAFIFLAAAVRRPSLAPPPLAPARAELCAAGWMGSSWTSPGARRPFAPAPVAARRRPHSPGAGAPTTKSLGRGGTTKHPPSTERLPCDTLSDVSTSSGVVSHLAALRRTLTDDPAASLRINRTVMGAAPHASACYERAARRLHARSPASRWWQSPLPCTTVCHRLRYPSPEANRCSLGPS